MGRVCYVPSLLWAEFMCRVDPIPRASSRLEVLLTKTDCRFSVVWYFLELGVTQNGLEVWAVKSCLMSYIGPLSRIDWAGIETVICVSDTPQSHLSFSSCSQFFSF